MIPFISSNDKQDTLSTYNMTSAKFNNLSFSTDNSVTWEWESLSSNLRMPIEKICFVNILFLCSWCAWCFLCELFSSDNLSGVASFIFIWQWEQKVYKYMNEMETSECLWNTSFMMTKFLLIFVAFLETIPPADGAALRGWNVEEEDKHFLTFHVRAMSVSSDMKLLKLNEKITPRRTHIGWIFFLMLDLTN